MTGSRDAVGTAAAVRSGEVDARAVVEDAIACIERLNPEYNAVIHTRFDRALEEVDAGLPDGPLRGVPVLIKDLGTDVAGLPSTGGSRLFAEGLAARDSELVTRYRRAGMVVLGSTNTPELGLNASTEPALFGPTRNPWSTAHSPGGSSGGSAVAVASGMVPVAHASDGGGSIRIPSAACGLFGLKPSRGRVSPRRGPPRCRGWSPCTTPSPPRCGTAPCSSTSPRDRSRGTPMPPPRPPTPSPPSHGGSPDVCGSD